MFKHPIRRRLTALFVSLLGVLAFIAITPGEALAGSFSSYVNCYLKFDSTGAPIEYVTFRWHLDYSTSGASRHVDILEFQMHSVYGHKIREVYDYEYNYGTGGKYGNGKDVFYSPAVASDTENYTSLEMPYIGNEIRASLQIRFFDDIGLQCGYIHDI